MNGGKRCGEKCNGSTIKSAIVYFPPGTYRVSTPIVMPFGTQVIGDVSFYQTIPNIFLTKTQANDWPTILAPRGFVGSAVLRANDYTGNGTGIDGLDQGMYEFQVSKNSGSFFGFHYQFLRKRVF